MIKNVIGVPVQEYKEIGVKMYILINNGLDLPNLCMP